MTLDEFNNGTYGAGDKVIYKNKTYPVHGLCFEEALFAIDVYDDDENLSWVRCENIEFISGINNK